MVLDDGGFARTYPVIDHRRPKLLKNTTKTTRRAACWRLITDLRRDNVPPGRISVLLLKTPRADEEKHLERMGLRRLTEDDVPHLGTATLQSITWSTVSGFKGLENDVIIVAGLTDIESDWHRGVAYVGMSRARTRLHVIIHEDCDKKRREREEEWRGRVDSDVEMLL